MKHQNHVRIIIHIGMPKTATTFLQKQVFPYLEDTNYIFGADTLRAFYYFRPNTFKNILISDELLSGYSRSRYPMNTYEKNLQIIKNCFLNPIILVCYRKQADFLWSFYLQTLRGGHTHSFHEYFNLQNNGVIKTRELNYCYRLSLLTKYFNQVVCYSYDSFVKNKEDTVEQILKELDLKLAKPIEFAQKINPSLETRLQVNFLKTMNKWNKQFDGFFYSRVFQKIKLSPQHIAGNLIAKFPSSAVRFDTAIKQEINKYYEEDWDMLQPLLTIR